MVFLEQDFICSITSNLLGIIATASLQTGLDCLYRPTNNVKALKGAESVVGINQ